MNPFDPNVKVFITFFIELKKYVLSTPQRRNIKINLFDVKTIRKEGWKSDHLPPPTGTKRRLAGPRKKYPIRRLFDIASPHVHTIGCYMNHFQTVTR